MTEDFIFASSARNFPTSATSSVSKVEARAVAHYGGKTGMTLRPQREEYSAYGKTLR